MNPSKYPLLRFVSRVLKIISVLVGIGYTLFSIATYGLLFNSLGNLGASSSSLLFILPTLLSVFLSLLAAVVIYGLARALDAILELEKQVQSMNNSITILSQQLSVKG